MVNIRVVKPRLIEPHLLSNAVLNFTPSGPLSMMLTKIWSRWMTWGFSRDTGKGLRKTEEQWAETPTCTSWQTQERAVQTFAFHRWMMRAAIESRWWEWRCALPVWAIPACWTPERNTSNSEHSLWNIHKPFESFIALTWKFKMWDRALSICCRELEYLMQTTLKAIKWETTKQTWQTTQPWVANCFGTIAPLGYRGTKLNKWFAFQ